MSEYVADTHALIWHLTQDSRLSQKARDVFVEADNHNNVIWISSITLVEIVYLIEKSRFPRTLLEQIFMLLDSEPENYRVLPLDAEIVRALQTIERARVSDMPDRIIGACAKYLDVPLVSKDSAFENVDGLKLLW